MYADAGAGAIVIHLLSGNRFPPPHPAPSQRGANKSLRKSHVNSLPMPRISDCHAKYFLRVIFLSQITHILAIP